MMKSRTIGGVMLGIVQLLLSALVVWYFFTPSIAILGSKEDVDLSAALIGVCEEDELDSSLGFMAAGGKENNVMKVTDFAEFLFKDAKALGDSLKGVTDVSFGMKMSPTWCTMAGLMMYAALFFACIDVVVAVLQIVFSLFANNKEKRSIFTSTRPPVFSIVIFYLTLACVQMSVLQPLNDAISKYHVGLRVMMIDTWHPALVFCGILVIFMVAKAIIAQVFHCDEEPPQTQKLTED